METKSKKIIYNFPKITIIQKIYKKTQNFKILDFAKRKLCNLQIPPSGLRTSGPWDLGEGPAVMAGNGWLDPPQAISLD